MSTTLATTPDTNHTDRISFRRTAAVILILAVFGLAVSIKLTEIHHSTHTDENYKSMCAVNDEVNCETVARSPYSVFLGAPVSTWGIFGYLLIGAFAGWRFFRKQLHDRWPLGILTALTGAAACASFILGYISFTKIDSLCLFCMTSYFINAVMLTIMTVVLIKRGINPIQAFAEDLSALLRKPLVFASIAVPATAAAFALMFVFPPYWQRPGWADLPQLKTGVTDKGVHWIGAENPILNIIEFSDYQCPFCRHAHRDIRLIAGKFPDEVRLLHRHFPLDHTCNKDMKSAAHEFACKFSKAAACAAEQGFFWEMNDALFSVQDAIKAADVNVERLAVELGLDRSMFVSCMKKKGTPKSIRDDIAEGDRLHLAATPTFFINGQSYEGGVPEKTVSKILNKIRKNRTEMRLEKKSGKK